MTLQTDDPRLLSLDTEMIQEAWAGIRRDCAGFIKAFVKIHNEDTGEPMLFALWPEQERVLKEVHEHRLNVILKARQLGFTWLCLAYCLWRMLCRAGLRTAAVSRTESEAKELVDRVVLMLRHLPQWMVTYGKPSDKGVTWESTSLEVKVHHPNGEDSRFQAYPAGPESARSYTASVLLLDEWAAQEYAKAIWTAAFPTINRPTGGRLLGYRRRSAAPSMKKCGTEPSQGITGFTLYSCRGMQTQDAIAGGMKPPRRRFLTHTGQSIPLRPKKHSPWARVPRSRNGMRESTSRSIGTGIRRLGGRYIAPMTQDTQLAQPVCGLRLTTMAGPLSTANTIPRK